MVPSGIRFNDYFFTEPTRLADLKVPKYAGLFVILATDANWAPKPTNRYILANLETTPPKQSCPGLMRCRTVANAIRHSSSPCCPCPFPPPLSGGRSAMNCCGPTTPLGKPKKFGTQPLGWRTNPVQWTTSRIHRKRPRSYSFSNRIRSANHAAASASCRNPAAGGYFRRKLAVTRA